MSRSSSWWIHWNIITGTSFLYVHILGKALVSNIEAYIIPVKMKTVHSSECNNYDKQCHNYRKIDCNYSARVTIITQKVVVNLINYYYTQNICSFRLDYGVITTWVYSNSTLLTWFPPSWVLLLMILVLFIRCSSGESSSSSSTKPGLWLRGMCVTGDPGCGIQSTHGVSRMSPDVITQQHVGCSLLRVSAIYLMHLLTVSFTSLVRCYSMPSWRESVKTVVIRTQCFHCEWSLGSCDIGPHPPHASHVIPPPAISPPGSYKEICSGYANYVGVSTFRIMI